MPILTITTNESAFVQVWECHRVIPTHCWRKMKVEFEYVKDSKRNTFTLPRHPSPRQHNSILKHLQCWRFLQEELRACEWVPRFLSYEGCCQRRPLASCSIQNTEMCYMTKGWGGARRRAARAIKGPKGMHILLPWRLYQEFQPQATEDASSANPNWTTDTRNTA